MSYDSQISQCRNDISLYRDLKNKLYTISSNFSVAANASSDVNSKLSVSYQVNDGDSKIGTRAKKLANDIDAKNGIIIGRVIPAIDQKISNLYDRISNLEYQKACAEAERRRREEEERRAREEAANNS